MAFYRTIDWATALDVAGILLCCLIIIYLFYNKIKYRRFLNDAPITGRGPDVKADITCKMVKQQVDRILYLVSGTLASELMILKEMTTAEGVMSDATLRPVNGSGSNPESDTKCDLLGTVPVGCEPDPYVEVTQLSRDGLSPQQIAEKIKLPLGEIELLLKLYGDRL
jgi:hypothetical protein